MFGITLVKTKGDHNVFIVVGLNVLASCDDRGDGGLATRALQVAACGLSSPVRPIDENSLWESRVITQ
jgi:hypothetical protein